MTTYLLHDSPLRSYELRHEIGEAIADPVIFLEHEGRRIAVCGPFEVPILSKREDVVDECWSFEQFGSEELATDPSFPSHLIEPEIALRVLQKLGISEVVVPPTFGVLVADHLRGNGITVTADEEAWGMRRRRKTPWELEGIERAQRAADTAMLVAARMLRESEPTARGELRFEGEVLTAGLLRTAMSDELVRQGAESEEILIQSGGGFAGHELGSGPILPDRSVIVDVFPRDRRTSAHSDMTRTFVTGEPSEEIKRMHAHVREALDVAMAALIPGRSDAFQKVCDFYHSNGYHTQLNKPYEGLVKEGFTHALGHGVGLEVHELPKMGRRSQELIEGDVVAVEPGLYFDDLGGVRLEDTVVITEGGPEHLTDPYPYDLSP